MLTLHRFVFNPFEENTYILIDSETSEAAIVDPGMCDSQEHDAISRFITQKGIRLTQIINTHMHLDHCFGIDYVRDKYNVKLYASPNDATLAKTVSEQARRFGMSHLFQNSDGIGIDVELNDGDVITIGHEKLTVISVPGHSEGGIALYCKSQKFIITGDSLFRGSIGRTDLPGGDHSKLIESIKTKLLALPDDTAVLPGHGPQSTIGLEKLTNPYLR